MQLKWLNGMMLSDLVCLILGRGKGNPPRQNGDEKTPNGVGGKDSLLIVLLP